MCLLASGPAAAAQASWHLTLDNDFFNFWQKPNERPDFGYTAGTDLSVHSDHIPRLLAPFAGGGRSGAGSASGPCFEFGLRQEIYAPWRLGGDRPYAGWLEVRLGLRSESANALRRWVAHAGVTGPPSLAQEAQDLIHKSFGFNYPGWSHQLPFEPGATLEYEGVQRVLGVGAERGLAWEVAPAWRARLGTIATDLRVGAQTALGWAPPPPWDRSDRIPRSAGIYALGAVRLDAIARDEFLDGTLFRPSARTHKRPVVAAAESGIGFRWRGGELEWRVTRRQKDFRTQPWPHTYSAIVLNWVPASEAGR